MPKRPAGFTLLEILVVLVLTSLVTMVLLQGLQQVYHLQLRFGAEGFRSQQEAMRVDWFRNSINGIMPDHADGNSKFKGEARLMSGQTTAPMNAPEGALVPFTWRIDFDSGIGEMALYAGTGEDAQAVLTWPGSEGRFLYVDGAGSVHDAWPPFLGTWPQVPRMIWLEMGAAGKGRKVIAVPRGPDKPWPRKSEVMTG